MSRRQLQTWLVGLVLLALAAVPGWAQLDTGRIVGTVVDKTGAAIASADIKITNQRTGRVTEAKTGSIGEFATPPLPVGVYKVEAARDGFKTAAVTDIVLHATETARADMKLDVGGASEIVEVTAEQTSVNTTSADLGATVDTTRVNNLPLNGRDFISLVALVPGSVTTTGGQNSIGGFETTYAGVNVLLDGADATRIDTNATSTQMGRQESRISRASVDSIAEFRVLQSNYSAEYGRSMGDILNVITKSGGNEFHGSVFEYLRNNKFDARNYFDKQENPLRLNQFGGNVSGPLVKDKLFFFTNYEGVRQVVHTPVEKATVLSAARRAQFVPSMYPVRDAIPVGNGGPVPDNPNLEYYNGALRNALREDTGSVKVDWNASTSDTFNFRYNIADSFTSTQYGFAAGQVSPSYSRNHLLKGTWNHTFAPTILNEFGVAFNRPQTNSLGGGGDFPIFQCFYCTANQEFGLTPGPALFSNRSPQYSYQFMDNLSWIKNRHSIRFGGDIRHNMTKRATDPQRFLSYAGINDFLSNTGFVLSTLGYDMVGIENTNYNFYFQDDIRVTSRLSLNLGLRYEYNSVLHGDRIANFDFASLKVLKEGDGLYEPDRNNFAPRVGFSYDPFGTGKTVIRGGFGIFFNPLLTGAGLQLAQNTQPTFNVNLIDLAFGLRSCTPALNIAYPVPATLPTCEPALPMNITFLDRNMRDTYAQHWSFGIQQELFKNTILELAYVGNHGVKLPAGAASAGLELNLEPWLGTPQIEAARDKYGNIRRFGNFLGSRYDALQASLRRHIGNGLNLDVNYTWSHEFDNAVNIFSAFQNSARPQDDWSVGDIDIRHNFTLALVYDVPAASWLPKGVAKGWQVSSLFQTRTGMPFNISMSTPFLGLDLIRPNLKPGQSIRPADYTLPNGQLNYAAFEDPGFLAYGNLPRNAGRGPGFAQLDFAVAKTTKLTERLGLQFRVETFNLLNRPNFANPVSTLSSGEDKFGKSVSTIGNKIGTGTSRQLQFVTKLVF